jgi:intracellular septation protein
MNKKQNPKSKNIFLLSFLPALAYWYLEANYPIHIAVMGGVGLAVLEVSLEYIFFKHVHTLSKFNFYLLTFLGGLSLLGDEGIWFKLQPAISGWVMGGFLLFKRLRGQGMMLEMMESMNPNKMPPKIIIDIIEKHFAIMIIVYGTWMAFVATMLDTDLWLFFKTIGFYLIFFVFMIGEMFYLRRVIKSQSN